MPTIIRYKGLVLKFYSDEHDPIHVHAIWNGHESVFEILRKSGEVTQIRVRAISKKKAIN